jgi:hypothetical protein
MIHLIPKNGARVRDPATKKIVGPEGIRVEKICTFWFRRIKDGCICEAPAAKIQSESKVKKGEN